MKKDVGKKFKMLREKAGFTQESLAKKLGIRVNTISRIENDHNLPTLETLLGMSRAFGMSLDEMVEEMWAFDEIAG